MFSQRALTQVPVPTGQGTDAFNAGTPLPPSPIGATPRQFQYRQSWNYSTPQTDRKVNYEVLRAFSRDYDLLARCLSRRKEELRTLHWSIQPTNRADKRKMHEIQVKYADDIERLTEFFRHPEALTTMMNGKMVRFPVHDYQYWLNAVLDDMLVLDTIAIVPRKNRKGDLISLERIDASTIKVLLDDSGRTPAPPDPAYQQWIFGMARENFTLFELIYRVYNPSNDTPLGMSVVQQIMTHIQLALKQEQFTKSYFDDGAIPQMLFSAPSDWSVTQMEELANYLNSRLAGNPAALHEFNFIPEGTDPVQLKPFDWNPELSKWIAALTCSLCGISPTEMNLEVHNSGLGGKSFGEIASDAHDKQVMYVSEFLQSLFNDIIHFYFGIPELSFVFDHMLEKDEEDRAKINDTLIRSGQKSLDDIYIENGREPLGIGPFFQANDRLYGLPDLKTLSKSGATAVNLGMVGGHTLPDGSKTKNIPLPQKSDGVTTGNPNQTKDPSAKLDVEDAEPKDGKHRGPQPPKPSAAPPKGPTVNTAKSTVADIVKDASQSDDNDDNSIPHLTHRQEMLLIAYLLRLWKRVPMSPHYLTPHLVQSSFEMSMHDTQQLANAIYEMKSDIYVESWNEMARADGRDDLVIDRVPQDVEIQLRQQAQQAAQSIADTHNADLQKQMDKLADADVTDPRQVLDALNEWQKDKSMFKAEQIATTEASSPWNAAVMDYDDAMGRTDQREYWVTPDHSQCDVCRDMVANNPYTASDVKQLPIPAHPGCIHYVISKPI